MFQTVKGDDLNITMQEANISTTGYVSDEVKEQQAFHHYNNTNFFVTFRDKYLKQKPIKELAANLRTYLLSNGTFGGKLRLKKLYQTYIVLELNQLSDLKRAADLLTS